MEDYIIRTADEIRCIQHECQYENNRIIQQIGYSIYEHAKTNAEPSYIWYGLMNPYIAAALVENGFKVEKEEEYTIISWE